MYKEDPNKVKQIKKDIENNEREIKELTQYIEKEIEDTKALQEKIK